MIFVSRVLSPRAGVRTNGVAAIVTTAFVIGGGSWRPHCILFAAVEIACMAIIVWSAWAWRHSEAAAPRTIEPHDALSAASGE